MKQTITKNEQSLKILNELISRGFYSGDIKNNGFELYRKNSNAKFWIVAKLNNNKFELRSEFRFPLSIVVWLIAIIWIIAISFFILKSKWLESIFFFSILLFNVINFLYESKKEVERFTSNFLRFYKDKD